MVLSSQRVRELLEAICDTRDRELTCGECWDHVAELAERAIAGKPIPLALASVEQHLGDCGECRQEYEALLGALRALEGEV